MKKQLMFPIAAGAGGLAAFLLRLLQIRTGFEPGTGLPVPGHPAALALAALLAAMAVLLAYLARRLPAGAKHPLVFPGAFITAEVNLLLLPMAGVFLMAFSGVLELLCGIGMLGGIVEMPGIGSVSLVAGSASRGTAVMGALSLVTAGVLFLAVSACLLRGGRESRSAGGIHLLLPVVALVIRLVFTYRIVSVDPSLQSYYVELLALVFLTLGFYRLSSFAFSAGRPGLFAFYAGEAVVLALACAAGGCTPASALLYLGGGAVLLGFLLLLQSDAPPADPLI